MTKITAAQKTAEAVKTNKLPTDDEMRASGMTSLSSRIRHLSSMGVSTADISRIVKRENGEHPRYQHVRHVLNTPLKPAAPTTETEAA